MEETTPKVYTPQELDAMGYAELRQIAKDKQIDWIGLNLSQLKMALGAAPEGAIVVDLAEGLPESLISERRSQGKRIPGKMIYTKDIEDAIWRVKENNPDAFDNVNFLDKNTEIQHIFTKKVKCTCGETMNMVRVIKQRKDNKEVEVVDPSPVYKKQCGCGKWYIYHPKENYEVRAKV
jgi:hypothetical protein